MSASTPFPYSDDWVLIDGGVVWVCPRGPLTVQTVLRLMERILATPGFVPGMPAIWDLRAATLNGLLASDARSAAAVAKGRRGERGSSRLAVIVSSSSDFAVVRMYEQWASGGPSDVRIVGDQDGAIAWARDGEEPKPYRST